MSFFENEEFRDFISAEFNETAQYATVEEMAEFALGSVGNAVVQFLNGKPSDTYILTYTRHDGSKGRKRLRLDLLAKEINNLLAVGLSIDKIVKLKE